MAFANPPASAGPPDRLGAAHQPSSIDSGWARALGPVLAAAGGQAQGSLALRFTLAEGQGRFGAGAGITPADVTIRPLRASSSGRWVSAGISWAKIIDGAVSADRSHVEALLGIARLRLANRYAYQSFPGELGLGELGLEVWRRLAFAANAGVRFIGLGIPAPRIEAEPARLRIIADHSREGGLALRWHIDHADTLVHGNVPADSADLDDPGEPADPADLGESADPADPSVQRWLIGESPHAVAARSATRLVIAPLQRAVDRSVVDAITAGQLIVPAADVPAFTSTYLPALRRFVAVEAGPGVQLQAAPAPRLQVRATYRTAEEMLLSSAFTYAGSSDGAYRDPGAEQVILDRLPTPPPGVSGLLAPRSGAGAAMLAGAQHLSGFDVVLVSTRLLPQLEQCEDIDLLIDGNRPDYRIKPSDPVIEFRVDDHLGSQGQQSEGNSLSAADRLERSDWFDLGITVRVGDQSVPFVTVFRHLAKGDPHVLLPDGQWFSLRRPEFIELAAIVAESRHLLDPGRSRFLITSTQLGLWEHLVALGVVTHEAAQWRERVTALGQAGQQDTLAQVLTWLPASLAQTLRPYQVSGLAWLVARWRYGIGGVLADDMGLGKTVQVLALLAWAKTNPDTQCVQRLGRDRPAPRHTAGQTERQVEGHTEGHVVGATQLPALVIAPTSVLDSWAQQAARFTPELRVCVLSATSRGRGTSLEQAVRGADVVITSYTIARLDAQEFATWQVGTLVLDEAQLVKNHTSVTYHAIRAIGARVRFAVTGTPLENSVMDVWAILTLTSPGLLPDPATFTDVYRRPIEEGTDPAKLDRLLARIRPLMLRRRKEDVAVELPPKQEQVVRVELRPEHRHVYAVRLARERQRVLNLIEQPGRNRIAMLQSLTLLRQLALAPELVDESMAHIESSKIHVLIELLADVIASGHRALVFSQFTRFLALLARRLDELGVEHLTLTGSTRDRAGLVSDFREGDAPVLLISLKAGGLGLTLVEADYVFVLDPWWNPAAENQAIDRAHRIGQDKPVMVYRLIAAGTIEEKVVALAERKRILADQILDSQDGGPTQLDPAQLSDEQIAALLQQP